MQSVGDTTGVDNSTVSPDAILLTQGKLHYRILIVD